MSYVDFKLQGATITKNYLSQIHFPKYHVAHFPLALQHSKGRKQKVQLSGNHKILHCRQRFYELTCEKSTATSNVTVSRK